MTVGYKQLVLAGTIGLASAVSGQAAQASQFRDALDGKFDFSQYLSDNAYGFLPVPIIISEPAVDSGLGLAGVFFHEDDEAAAERKEAMATSEYASHYLLPPSLSVVAGVYTGNESWLAAGGHMGFYREGAIRYEGFVGYGDINLDYYSVGDLELDEPFSLKTKAAFFGNTVKFRIGDLPLYIGPSQAYIGSELSPRNLQQWFPEGTDPEIIDSLTDLLTAEITTSGLGIDIELDMRDNLFTPTEGFAYTLDVMTYQDALGSDVEYESLEFEGLNYFKFNEHWRAGLRLGAELVESDDILPPFAMPDITLRGIPAARYQGERVAYVEGELTWQINLRWSALAFVGSGWASDSGSELFSSSSRVSQGVGFRYTLARHYGLHAGLDIARGPEDTVWYIQVGSAW
jgi:hypothetical protein